MRFLSGVMLHAAICSMTDPNAPTGSIGADLTEDLKEAGEGVKSFIAAEIDLVKKGITAESALIKNSVANASDWLKAKADQLSADAQTGLAAVIQHAAANSKDPVSLVSSVLTVLYDDAKTVALGLSPAVVIELKAVESSVLAGVAGLTTLVPFL